MATQPNPSNPWFGIPADVSGKMTTTQEAQDYWNSQLPPNPTQTAVDANNAAGFAAAQAANPNLGANGIMGGLPGAAPSGGTLTPSDFGMSNVTSFATSENIGNQVQAQMKAATDYQNSMLPGEQSAAENDPAYLAAKAEAQRMGEKALSGLSAQQGTGIGLNDSSIRQNMITEQKKTNDRIMSDLEDKMKQSVLTKNTADYDKYMTAYQQAQDNAFKIQAAQLDVVKTNIAAATANADIASKQATTAVVGQKIMSSGQSMVDGQGNVLFTMPDAATDVKTAGDPKVGLYERQADGTWKLVIAPPANGDEHDMVLKMQDEFKDAGILPTDSLATATKKLQSSKIYKDKIRGPVGNNITINAAGSRTPFFINGKQAGYQTYNDTTGKVQVFDINGKPLSSLPSGAELGGSFGGGAPTPSEQSAQLKSQIQAFMATSDFKGKSRQEQMDFIRNQGADPADFGFIVVQ